MVVGAFSIDWALVQPQIAAITKICTYDVAGTAWSDAGPASTCPERVNEIHTLLHHAGVEGPYVFAGLSIGGLISRFYASQYPSEVVGMVIVDHAFIPGASKPDSHATPSGDSPPVLIESTPIILTTEETSAFEKLPANIRELHRWAESRRPVLDNAATADDCVSRLKAAAPGPYPLGSLPLIVVSTGNQASGYSELQAALLALSRNSKQLMADQSFHSVEIDQPEVVIRALVQAIEQVRQGR
jgi:pimeloyl-ACP methyl ester carboxylesterase